MASQRLSSPFYVDKSLGGAFTSLADMLAGDMNGNLSRDAANYASAGLHDAQRDKVRTEIDQIGRTARARAELGDIIKRAMVVQEPTLYDPGIAASPEARPSFRDSRPATTEELQMAAPDILRQSTLAYPEKPGAGADQLAAVLAAMGDDDAMRRSLVLTGKMPGPEFAGTAQRADAVSNRNALEAERLQGVRERGMNARNAADNASRQAIETMKDERALVPVFRDGEDVYEQKSKAAGMKPGVIPKAQADRFVRTPDGNGGWKWTLQREGVPADTPASEVERKAKGEPVFDDTSRTGWRYKGGAADGMEAPTPPGERPRPPKTVKMGPKDLSIVEGQIAGLNGLNDDDPIERLGRWNKVLQSLSPQEREGYYQAIGDAWNEGGGDAGRAAAAGANYIAGLGQVSPGGYGFNTKLVRKPAAPTMPGAGAVPQRPQGLPAGSAYSPSRKMWRTPDGRMFDATGRPVS